MGWIHSVFSPGTSQSLPKDDPTIAEMLRPLGYATGMSGGVIKFAFLAPADFESSGKWHLGINNKTNNDGVFLPFYRGFDEVGHMLPFSNHWQCDESGRHMKEPNPKLCYLYHNTTVVQQPFDHSNLTRTIVADVTGFIERRAEDVKPWFYYLAFPQCHVSMFTGAHYVREYTIAAAKAAAKPSPPLPLPHLTYPQSHFQSPCPPLHPRHRLVKHLKKWYIWRQYS
jgi:arylsulfatase A-like enzyme